MYVPSGLPGARPSALNCSVTYATELSSPAVPGPRPSKPSDARRFTCWRMLSAVIAASAGCSAALDTAASRLASSPLELHARQATVARTPRLAVRRKTGAFTFAPLWVGRQESYRLGSTGATHSPAVAQYRAITTACAAQP